MRALLKYIGCLMTLYSGLSIANGLWFGSINSSKEVTKIARKQSTHVAVRIDTISSHTPPSHIVLSFTLEPAH